VCEDASEGIWLGTMGGGIARWKDGRLTDVVEAPGGGGRGLVFSAFPGASG
jgi:ligand-binding sensor domain-containing protein